MTGANSQPRLFAVVGHPVLHSRSPAFQTAGFKAAGIPAMYLRLTAPSAASALRTAREMGLSGFNITAPFKEDFAKLVDELDEAATRVGAVNTVLLDPDGRARGFNTDVAGVALALRSNVVDPTGKRALIIGAGGAARAAAVALLEAGANVVVTNRDFARAQALVARVGGTAVSLQSRALVDAAAAADIVIGCASTTEQILPSGVLRPGTAVLEALYAQETALVRAALSARCTVVDGREWLLYQGTRAFELFTEEFAPVGAMREALYVAKPPAARNIALVGFMGAGKSHTGERLHDLLGWEVEDIDARVERRAGISIREVFAHRGEAAFRDLEAAELREVLRGSGRVISCGGGAVLDSQSVKQLRDNSLVVWLWARLPTLLERLSADSSRPLLAGEDREAAARELLASRVPSYASAADLVIDTSELTPDRIAEVIVDEAHPARAR